MARYRAPVLPAPTPRLRFREMVAADLPDVSCLDIGGSRDPEGWIAWNQENYVHHGFGLWVVETPAGEFIGDCGLTMQEVEDQWLIEVGWHVRPAARRRGYATEAAVAVRDAAHGAGVEHLIAIVRADNRASQAVARKIGLEPEREIYKDGRPALIFGADLHPVSGAR